jgi:hypothetical protein
MDELLEMFPHVLMMSETIPSSASLRSFDLGSWETSKRMIELMFVEKFHCSVSKTHDVPLV